MTVLTERLLALAAPAPVMLLLEDAHWIDPTTRELFDVLVDRIESAPILVVVTHRPEFTPTWTGRPFVTALAFTLLSKAVLRRDRRHPQGARRAAGVASWSRKSCAAAMACRCSSKS